VVKVMRDDLHVLSGSYVLDALGEPERDSFERHLQHCPLCEDEVRGLRETAARLGLAKTVDPPPHLRPRVLAAAYRTRQLPPPVDKRIGLDRRRPRVRVPRLAAALAAASGRCRRRRPTSCG
jgi:anti-sigma factor RsiW